MKINIRIISNSEICDRDIREIAILKDQHWTYGIQSQIAWAENNLVASDQHLMIEETTGNRRKLLAYMNLTDVQMEINGIEHSVIGIGNVCVDKKSEHCGIGRILMNEANGYILESRKQGVLLCRDKLLGFYEKCGWYKLETEETYICNQLYRNEIMVYPAVQKTHYTVIRFNRNF